MAAWLRWSVMILKSYKNNSATLYIFISFDYIATDYFERSRKLVFRTSSIFWFYVVWRLPETFFLYKFRLQTFSAFYFLKNKIQFVLHPQASLILFLAPFDPLWKKMICITMATPTEHKKKKKTYQENNNNPGALVLIRAIIGVCYF